MSTQVHTTQLSLLISAVFCLALPFVWNHLAPSLVDEAPLEYEFSWNEPSVEIAEAGRYSIYGNSGNHDARPLEVFVGDTRVSSLAFFHNTGSRTKNFVRHRIATRVWLEAGSHRIRLVDRIQPDYRGRFLRFEFRREKGLGALRLLAISLAGLLILGLRQLLLARFSLSPTWRLTATLAGTASVALAPIAWWAWEEGASIGALDRADDRRSGRTEAFEHYLASDAHAQAQREDRFSVFVMGDSTHFWPHPPEHQMLPSIRRAIPANERERIEVYGLSFGAGGAFDFMFLLQRIVDEEPDLVIIPVSLRSFGDRWIRGDPDYRRVEQFLRLEDLIDSHGLSFASRTLDWTRILTGFLDEKLFDNDAAPFLFGAKRYVQMLRTFWTERWVPQTLREPAPRKDPTPLERMREVWPASIDEDGRQIDAFRRISRVAARHGIPLVYYTGQPNESAIRRNGFDPQAREKFARIGASIGQEPHVTYLDFSEDNRASQFSDESDHLSLEGMGYVAGRLAEVIVERAREGR